VSHHFIDYGGCIFAEVVENVFYRRDVALCLREMPHIVVANDVLLAELGQGVVYVELWRLRN